MISRLLFLAGMSLLSFGTVSAAEPGTTATSASQPENLELFLLIGQSNMAGRGPIGPEDKVVHPRVFMLTKEKTWAPALDPLHFDKPDIAGVGLASTFARVVADAEPKARIGLIPAAFGGTSLDQWKPGGELYTNAVARARLAQQRGKLVAILWHQGEADSGDATLVATYTERFKAMVQQLRTDLGEPKLPILVGELGEYRPSYAEMNEVLKKLPDVVPNCRFVSSAGFKDKGDQTHFDTPSLHEFGRRYAQAYFSLKKP